MVLWPWETHEDRRFPTSAQSSFYRREMKIDFKPRESIVKGKGRRRKGEKRNGGQIKIVEEEEAEE